MTATQHLLYQEMQTLPDDLATEVLDFIQFLKSDLTEEDFLWSQVEETYPYRRQRPDDIMTVTGDEWLADTAQMISKWR